MEDNVVISGRIFNEIIGVAIVGVIHFSYSDCLLSVLACLFSCDVCL